VTFLLFAVSAANAAPTISNGDVLYCAVSPSSNLDIKAVPELAELTEYSDSHLASVAAEFLKPPTDFPALAASPVINAKALPAVPAAFLMVLTGFLCISLVRDRKIWLAALAGLLWAGQTGLQVLPQLALRLGHNNYSQQKVCGEFTYPFYLENSDRLRSDIEGTQYIGLLHHLAGIPDSTTSRLQPRLSFLPRILVRDKLQQVRNTQYVIRNTNEAPQFAIIKLLSRLIPPTICLAPRAEQFICFSPAFIFENLPRGPPKLA